MVQWLAVAASVKKMHPMGAFFFGGVPFGLTFEIAANDDQVVDLLDVG
jgi:hypothetical protein